MNRMSDDYYASSLKKAISPWVVLATLVSWGLASALVYNLLGGDFAQRSCQTLCVQMIALASVIVAALGLIPQPPQQRGIVTILCQLSMLGLVGMYLTTYFIGTVFG